jgi:DNA invertase Pin-like site-specific DNA recombinase
MTIQDQPVCISYSRYSSDAQIGGTSIERQTREAAAWARTNGYRLDTELSFQDEAKSAWSGEHAKSGAFSELLEAVRAGRIPRGSAVYIEAFDRLSRQGIRKTTRLLEDIIEHGVDVVVKDQVYDSSALDDPMAMIMLVIRATEAKVASDDKSRRVKAAWAQKRERATAKPLTKNGPAWLRLMDGAWAVIADRAGTVRRIFDLALAGHGALAICKRLNDDKVPTLDAGRLRGPMPKSGVRAGDWRQSTVKHLLRYRAVLGEYVSGDGATTVPGYWPAIIDAETFHAVQAVRATKAARGPRHDQAPKSIVAGLAVCAACGRSMTRIRKGNSAKTWFVCTGARLKATDCGYGSVAVARVEEALRRDAWAFTGYMRGDGPSPTAGELEAAQERAETLARSLDNLLDTTASTGTPSRALKERIQAAERELEVAREDIVGLQHIVAASAGPMVEARLDRLRDQFDAGDVAGINAALKAVAKAVVVDRQAAELRIEFYHGGTAIVLLG